MPTKSTLHSASSGWNSSCNADFGDSWNCENNKDWPANVAFEDINGGSGRNHSPGPRNGPRTGSGALAQLSTEHAQKRAATDRGWAFDILKLTKNAEMQCALATSHEDIALVIHDGVGSRKRRDFPV
jgi:hypothetical protein